ncbi:hypothetical protein Lal_00028243 [Lupinus albus]|nr:hypothetical protein Lal_00028243 [Lupinus albus]
MDRFLISSEWDFKGSSLIQRGLKRSISDHCPVVLFDKDQDWGPRPFRVINAWFDDKDFATFVKDNWEALSHPSGWRMGIRKSKLQKLNMLLKKWNKEHFGNIDQNIAIAEQCIHNLDLKGEASGLNDDEVIHRSQFWADLWLSCSMQHNMLS